MRLILKAGVLVLTLTAVAVSTQAGKLKNAPTSATPESDDIGGSSVVGAGQRSFRPGEVLVSLPSNLSLEAIDALAQRHRLTRMESQSSGLLGRTVHRWRIADGRSIPSVILALKLDGGINAECHHAKRRSSLPKLTLFLTGGAGSWGETRGAEAHLETGRMGDPA